MKTQSDQRHGWKEPRQERSRYKVQLILEATVRLLEKSGLDGLTTNAIAASAGVSIGTLYQFFPHKEAILDVLADREVAEMSAGVMKVLDDASITTPEERIAAVVGAVAASYGGRQKAHRLVMAHSLVRGGNRLAPLLSKLIDRLSAPREIGAYRDAMDPADAFVLAHAFAGVLRAMVGQGSAPPKEEVARSLSCLVTRFLQR